MAQIEYIYIYIHRLTYPLKMEKESGNITLEFTNKQKRNIKILMHRIRNLKGKMKKKIEACVTDVFNL